MKKSILMSIVVAALVASLSVGMASACVGPGMSPGFWKHNLGIYLQEANGSYSNPTPNPIVSKDTMAAFFANLEGTEDLEQLYEDLCTQGGGAVGAATRVNAANIFNAAADLYPY